MNQGGIVPSRGEMKARLLEERVSALETKVAELSTSTNKQSTPLPFEFGYYCRKCGEIFSGEALPLLHRC